MCRFAKWCKSRGLPNLISVKFHEAARVDPARLMNIVSGVRGAQFSPAGVLLLPLEGHTDPGAVLQYVSGRLEQLRGGAQ